MAVYGPEKTPHNSRVNMIAGPLVWPTLPPPSRTAYRLHKALSPFIKRLILVRDGVPTTLAIPVNERSRIALHYGSFGVPRSTWRGISWFSLSDGKGAVTFKPCPRSKTLGGWTEFAGGFIVKGPQCVTLSISRGRRRLHPRFAFGERCP